ncbi:MAG TPA: 4-hydroxythreonine-4-phosphate dehydrogenase PdxA [Bacteroidetes bacterium]|nr:4-hydroxythreonine-4-phosphate dehydrogenase PdxA [Bacteroidota bacterium]
MHIFINCGDPNGIGPEVTLKALAELPQKKRSHTILAGSYNVLQVINKMLGEPLALERVESLDDAKKVEGIPVLEPKGALDFQPSYGLTAVDSGGISGRGIVLGVAACMNGGAAALVTAPSSKEALHLAGFHYPGQTEMIASLCRAARFIMILAAGKLRVGIVTTHVAVRDVSELLRRSLVRDKISILHETVINWFRVDNPRLAVTSLNPHASEGGLFGWEEEEIIIPAIEDARSDGVLVEGPFPADTLFPRWKDFDAILAMYHDQGMIPVKMAGFGRAVNATGGLPFPRTSPDHGTAFDIAGKMIADPGSMKCAIEAAFRFAGRH